MALRYLQLLLSPQRARLGFMRMGLGIEQRAARFRHSWEAHFRRSIDAQRKWLESIGGGNGEGRLAVLGAGRLYDFCPELTSRFSNVDLVDADPLCRKPWRDVSRKHAKAKFAFHECEMTGSLAAWDAKFRSDIGKADWPAALGALKELEPVNPNPLETYLTTHKPEAILSLNLLSQIPVMWQGLVEKALTKKFGKKMVKEKEEEWIAAFTPSARKLLREHLKRIAGSRAKWIQVITDIEYLYYPALLAPGEPVRENPFLWVDGDDGGTWKLKDEIDRKVDESWKDGCYRMDSLYEINLENPKLLSVFFSDHEVKLGDSWLWHIVPEPEDGATESILHRVRALEIRRKE